MQVPSDFAAHAYSYICCICSCNAILRLLVSQVSPACVALLRFDWWHWQWKPVGQQ